MQLVAVDDGFLVLLLQAVGGDDGACQLASEGGWTTSVCLDVVMAILRLALTPHHLIQRTA